MLWTRACCATVLSGVRGLGPRWHVGSNPSCSPRLSPSVSNSSNKSSSKAFVVGVVGSGWDGAGLASVFLVSAMTVLLSCSCTQGFHRGALTGGKCTETKGWKDAGEGRGATQKEWASGRLTLCTGQPFAFMLLPVLCTGEYNDSRALTSSDGVRVTQTCRLPQAARQFSLYLQPLDGQMPLQCWFICARAAFGRF